MPAESPRQARRPLAPQPRWLCYAARSTITLLYFTIGIMSRRPFITFEGSEGCGKSTQVQRLATRLNKLQIPFLTTREPGGTPIGETIRELFFDSTTVYQGAARRLDREIVERLNAFVVGDCVPDVTFVLDVDTATAESRMQKRPRRADRMEQEPAEFYELVRRGYRDLAAREPNRIVLIDGSRNADEIENETWKILCSRFPHVTSDI